MTPLAGKVALVTGASRGIGRAIARRLAAAGCDVAVNYFNSHDEAEALCDEIRASGRRARALQANVASPQALDELFARLRDEFSSLDIVVNNAASGVLRPVLDLTPKHWHWTSDINALALQMIAERAAPHMPRGSRMIAISSLGASRALPGYAFVGASKAALEALVRSLAVELAPQGIAVNAVSAGLVDTDALKAFPEREAMLAEFAGRAPIGRVLAAEDVAGAVYLLCVPEAETITGHTLVVDGGYSIRG